MALTKRAKETNQKKELIVTAQMLAEIRLVAERIGGIENFNYAMDVWEYKGPKKRIEDVISPEELAKIYFYDEDGNLFSRETGKQVGYFRRKYLIACVSYKDYHFFTALNKIIFCLHNGRWAKKGYDVDHINRIKTDNRPCNLRESTKSENGSNKSVLKNNKLGVKNVFLTDKYCIVKISKNGKRYEKRFTRFKKFSDEELIQKSIAWRDEIGLKLHGEFYNGG
jgi:hypothetical protein